MSNIRVANPPPPERPPATPAAPVPASPFVLPQAVPTGGKPAGAADARAPRIPAKSGDAQAASNRWGVADGEDEPDRTADEPAGGSDRPLSVNERSAPQDQQPDEDRSAPSPAGAGATASVTGALAAAEDFSLSDELAQMSDSGIFEVLLPDGESLGVAVDVRATGIGFLLSPSGDKLRTRLQTQQMELEDVLKRRMGRSVKIAIL
jgi:hypothetical protein